MKLKFKVQPYQVNAVEAVVDCFAGQPLSIATAGRIEAGRTAQIAAFEDGFRNVDIALSNVQVLANIQAVQKRQNLPLSASLTDFFLSGKQGENKPASAAYKRDALAASRFHLDVEMETGTGKTYCYIKTVFELNKRYGWSKFIVMVPTVAIREGVYKSLQITADHFTESYGKKARLFIYNSKRLHELESFSSDAGINVMVINIQAFNAKGADNRRIYDELDDFQSRKPIDVIAGSRPILILDEPQKMEGAATMEALPKFRPLMILRYSATHRTQHNKVHRLDALDAYNQKLVKKIAVRGIQTRGLAGTSAYLYLEGIDISTKAPVARIELEVKFQSGEVRRKLRRLESGRNLFDASGGLDQYRRFTISQIDARTDTVEFTNGAMLHAGEATGDVSERDIRRIQIRETVKAHLEREKQLFAQGIKVLSLFFIDEVRKYRDYDQADEKGEYARIFEEEYGALKAEYLSELALDNEVYRKYLAAIAAAATHNGYFSVDKRTNRLVDPAVGARTRGSDEAGTSNDADAYDLILKDKERLLSLDEPTRFIFSHSALREGWDNPNVFVMCMLKHSDNAISRRQEVGRGLRLCVNQHGDRVDAPAVVHDINVLTVVASESYKDFVTGLQQEIAETLSSRPRQATREYFTGKIIATETGLKEITPAQAQLIYRYLARNGYTDDTDHIARAYDEAKAAGTLAELPNDLKPYADQIFALIDGVLSDAAFSVADDGRRGKTNPLKANCGKQACKELWEQIDGKAVHRVAFDSDEFVRKSIAALDTGLRVAPLQYTVKTGMQRDALTNAQLSDAKGFSDDAQATYGGDNVSSAVKYDLVGKIAENVQSTRKTAAAILTGIEPAVFGLFKKNPEHFIAEASRIIADQKATMIIECLTYDETDGRCDAKTFTAGRTGRDFPACE